MSDEPLCVVVCESIHDMLAVERTVKQAKLWCDLVPTPRQVSSDCGMALSVHLADLGQIAGLLAEEQKRYIGIFQEAERGYTLIHKPS